MFYVTKTKECKEKKVFVLSSSLRTPDLSPQGPLDFLSACLGIDSQLDWAEYSRSEPGRPSAS